MHLVGFTIEIYYYARSYRHLTVVLWRLKCKMLLLQPYKHLRLSASTLHTLFIPSIKSQCFKNCTYFRILVRELQSSFYSSPPPPRNLCWYQIERLLCSYITQLEIHVMCMIFSHCSGMECLRKEICYADVLVECNTYDLSDGTLRNIPWSQFNVTIRYSETHPLKGNHTLRVFNP